MYQIITSQNDSEAARMSDFVRVHHNGHVLQSPQWSGVKPRWFWRGVLVYDSNHQITGAMSVLVRPLPLGMTFLYAPRGPVCDRRDKGVLLELLEGIQAIAKQCRALFFCMDPDEHDDNEAFRAMLKSAGFSEKSSDGFDNIQPQYVFRLSIAGRSEEELFSSFSSKTRYNIRLALRHGVEIKRFGGGDGIPEDAMASFSALMEETGRRDHFIVRNTDYFQRLFAALGNDAELFLAYWQGSPIAGSIAVFYGNKAWYLYGASANEHRSTMPNYLLQWKMICRAVERECFLYDFRGVPGEVSQSHPLYGLYRFKKGFGGDYVKFTGLYIHSFRPLLSRTFLFLLRWYRKLRAAF